jgi:hypothetical protein
MTWEELTDEQRAVLSDYVRNLRAWTGEQARTNNHSDALNTAYVAGVSTILGLLGASEQVHDGSGLGGAMTLTQAEVITLTSHIQGVLTNYNTSGHRQLWAKAAGSSNLIG